MKKLFGIMVVLAIFASCTKSPEQKANAMIKEQLQKTLYHPDTYQPAETKLDSAFAPFDDPIFYEKTVKLAKLGMAIDKYSEEANDEKSHMAIWSGPYQTAYGRNEYQEAKAKYNKALDNKEAATKQANKLGKELRSMAEKGKKFIGFKAMHSYRANNNAGQTVFGQAEFIFDKDMTQIITIHDMDDDEYKAVQYLYKMMRGEDTIGDDISLDDNI